MVMVSLECVKSLLTFDNEQSYFDWISVTALEILEVLFSH